MCVVVVCGGWGWAPGLVIQVLARLLRHTQAACGYNGSATRSPRPAGGAAGCPLLVRSRPHGLHRTHSYTAPAPTRPRLPLVRSVAGECVREHGFDSVRLLRLPANRGKGAAVRAGALCARGAAVLFMDADGATRVSDLDKLEAALVETAGEGLVHPGRWREGVTELWRYRWGS